MNDLPLFSYIPSHNVATSLAAASKMRKSAKYWQFKVLQRIREAGDYGITRSELCEALNADSANVQPRISVLKNTYGLVKYNGEQRENRKGNKENVVVAV